MSRRRRRRRRAANDHIRGTGPREEKRDMAIGRTRKPPSGPRRLLARGCRLWLGPLGGRPRPPPGRALGMGGRQHDTARETAVDSTGNAYVAGSFTGTADFDPGPGSRTLTAEAESGYVARYSADGAL